MAAINNALPADPRNVIALAGSGDFHHLSLGLVGRVREACNLLVLDAHPDWMRGVPFLHCGTWLYHAARLPNVVGVYHVGGQTDFDNRFRWLAPWPMLRSGKIKVMPGAREFQAGGWVRVRHRSLRASPEEAASRERVQKLVDEMRDELAARPLYISIDKDVLRAEEAVTNWDCGRLTLAEVACVVGSFLDAAGGRLAGADIVGDWSPVRTRGVIATASHYLEHPRVTVHADEAARRNELVNVALLEALGA